VIEKTTYFQGGVFDPSIGGYRMSYERVFTELIPSKHEEIDLSSDDACLVLEESVSDCLVKSWCSRVEAAS